MIEHIPYALGWATLAPLAAFFAILIAGARMPSKAASGLSISAILFAAVMAFYSLVVWQTNHPVGGGHEVAHGEHAEHANDGKHGDGKHDADQDHNAADHKSGDADEHAADDDQHHGAKPSSDEQLPPIEAEQDGMADVSDTAPHKEEAGHHGHEQKPEYSGVYWTLGTPGKLRLEIGYYIDSLTICMFAMVTLIASCIHFYASGYMHDEEAEEVTDDQVPAGDGFLKRPGRYHRFFQSLSLFCFSMLGLVLAGNIAMVFVFWELVGICSYFLIGFYVERRSASTAANKAFITNRVGDFGMILGLMAIWSGIGTFNFGDTTTPEGVVTPGIFSSVRPAEHGGELRVPDQMVQFAAKEEMAALMYELGPDVSDEVRAEKVAAATEQWREKKGFMGAPYGYWMLILAGVGIFCGCVGKSAQFPLHVWLPDAMEGPTPVSALVHSATMVAAGVYLVGRFFPVFVPEVLLVIAVCGCITLFMAATIAITATDIKRVLAYSTISQLGYMMLALGLGGWLPGLMHLITHAFFKSLLFMCSGSVIHGVHTNEMPLMGGLRKKMPVTAYTMLIGCLAIAGAGIPFLIGFSGYYSKDKILEQAFSFSKVNGGFGLIFFLAAAGGAAITAFYMFRLWYMTFAGKPRDQARYDHAHESPKVMYMPLVILSFFAIGVAWGTFEATLVGAVGLVVTISAAIFLGVQGKLSGAAETTHDAHASHDTHSDHGDHGHHHDSPSLTPQQMLFGSGLFFALLLCFVVPWSLFPITLEGLLEQARPVPTYHLVEGETVPSSAYTQGAITELAWPDEGLSHDFYSIVMPATITAFSTALGGILLATFMYGLGWLNPAEVQRQFNPVYKFLVNKWWFDELYEYLFIKPTHVVSGWFAWLDRKVLDGIIHWVAGFVRWFSVFWERLADRTVVDGFVNRLAACAKATGSSFRYLQTGNLRQYVMFIVVGAVVVFLLITFFWSPGVVQAQ